MDHDKLNSLVQYCNCFTKQLVVLEQRCPHMNKDELSRCANGLVRVTKELIDNEIIGGEKVSEPKISNDSIFWAQVITCILLMGIGISLGIGYMAIADLENCAYKGMCVETPKGGK